MKEGFGTSALRETRHHNGKFNGNLISSKTVNYSFPLGYLNYIIVNMEHGDSSGMVDLAIEDWKVVQKVLCSEV